MAERVELYGDNKPGQLEYHNKIRDGFNLCHQRFNPRNQR